MKERISFSYQLEDDDYNTLKDVSVYTQSSDEEDVINAFLEFCACIGIRAQGAVHDLTTDDEKPH
jgi:hypothetical protein